MTTDTLARDLEMVARTKWNLLATIAGNLTPRRVDAEDVVQDAFLTVWRKRDQWGEINDAVTFMTAFTRYSAMRTWPSNDRWAGTVLVDFAARYDEPGYINPRVFADYRTTPAYQYAEEDPHAEMRRRLVAEVLAILTPRQRQVVEMYWLRGMSFSVIGKELNITARYAKESAMLSMRKIRVHFGEPELVRRSQARPVNVERFSEGRRARAAEAARLLREEDLTRQQIGERMGVCERRARGYLADARALGYVA